MYFCLLDNKKISDAKVTRSRMLLILSSSVPLSVLSSTMLTSSVVDSSFLRSLASKKGMTVYDD
jgi:hypothetical protein